MAKTQPRKRLNPHQVQKKIDNDFRRKFTFVIPKQGAVEFIAPPENHMNRILGHDRLKMNVTSEGKFSPDGEYGNVKYYYIPQRTHKQVTELLQVSEIPEALHYELTWVFLNMVFASCHAAQSDHSYEQSEKNQKEVCDTLDFLELLTTEKILLRGSPWNTNTGWAEEMREVG